MNKTSFTTADRQIINEFFLNLNHFYGKDCPISLSVDNHDQPTILTLSPLNIKIKKENDKYVFQYEDNSFNTFEGLSTPINAILAKLLDESFTTNDDDQDDQDWDEDESVDWSAFPMVESTDDPDYYDDDDDEDYYDSDDDYYDDDDDDYDQ